MFLVLPENHWDALAPVELWPQFSICYTEVGEAGESLHDIFSSKMALAERQQE